MDIRAQPFQQAAELPGFNLLLEIGDCLVDLLPQLRRNQVAQGVGGEVAEHPARPVHVLQHAQPVVGRGDAQVFLHARVPDFGQITHRQAAFQQRNFDLHAQHDVQVVGGLVGLHADQ